MPRADGQQDREEHRPEHRFGLARELAHAHERQLHSGAKSAAWLGRRYSSRRCRPVSETNTSSSVAEWVRSSLDRRALARKVLEQGGQRRGGARLAWIVHGAVLGTRGADARRVRSQRGQIDAGAVTGGETR